MLRELYERVKGLLAAQLGAVDALATALLESESLDGGAAGQIIDAHLSIERPESA